jgi:hypothetical protein
MRGLARIEDLLMKNEDLIHRGFKKFKNTLSGGKE